MELKEKHEKQLHNAESALEASLTGMGMNIESMKRLQEPAYQNLLAVGRSLLPAVLEEVRSGGNVQTITINDHLGGEQQKFYSALKGMSRVTDELLLNALADAAEQGISLSKGYAEKHRDNQSTASKNRDSGSFSKIRL